MELAKSYGNLVVQQLAWRAAALSIAKAEFWSIESTEFEIPRWPCRENLSAHPCVLGIRIWFSDQCGPRMSRVAIQQKLSADG